MRIKRLCSCNLLRERIKKLISDYKELKKLYEAREGMVQDKRDDAIIQE